MRRVILFTAFLALVAMTAALPTSAAPSGEFKAQFQDDDCATHTQCGTGLVEGYGHVTTTVDITGAEFDPSSGCLINVTAIRDVQLDGDPSSTLTLALTDGVISRQQRVGNVHDLRGYRIVRRTGCFAWNRASDPDQWSAPGRQRPIPGDYRAVVTTVRVWPRRSRRRGFESQPWVRLKATESGAYGRPFRRPGVVPVWSRGLTSGRKPRG